MDEFRITSGRLGATIKAQGAELCSLEHARSGELLWQAEPIWPAHAPNLFPIVGQLTNDELHVAGATYHLTRHGFARRRRFTWLDQSATACTLELRDDAETRALYPYAFVLEIGFAVAEDTLTVSYVIRNPASTVLPASIGAHPAFRWPLAAGIAKAAHTLQFSASEPAPIRRLQDGLLKPEAFASPIKDRTLELDESLFAQDAIIMDQPASTSVRYTAPAAPAIDVAWMGFRELGLWSKAGGDFLCIEPWYGYASPIGFDGPFPAKPGLLLVAPGAAQTLTMRIRASDA